MRRNYTMLTLRLILIGMIGLGLIGIVGCGGSTGPGGGDRLGATASITLSSGMDTLPADGATTTSITVILTDSSGAAVDAYTSVKFTTDLGSFRSGLTTLTTETPDESGAVTVPFNPGTVSGTAHITVESNGIKQRLEITITEDLPVAQVAVSFSPEEIYPQGIVTVTAVVTNSNGNAMEGETILFSVQTNVSGGKLNAVTAVTDDIGEASVTYTAGSIEGSDILKATAISNTIFGTRTLVVDSDSVTVSSIVLTSGSDTIYGDDADQTAIRATVTGPNASVISGAKVKFTTTLGTFLSNNVTAGTTIEVITDETGVAQTTLRAETALGTATITGTAGDFSSNITVTIEEPPRQPAYLSLSPSKTSVKTDNQDFVTITATVLDANRVPIEGVVVSFTTDVLDDENNETGVTAGQISASNVETDADGLASITFKSGAEKKNQTVDIKASASGSLAKKIPIQVTGTYITLSTVGSTGLEIGGDSVTLVATVKDAGGTSIFDVPLTATLEQNDPDYAGNVTLALSDTNTDVNGQVTITITATDATGLAGDVKVNINSLGASASQDYSVGDPGNVFKITYPLPEDETYDKDGDGIFSLFTGDPLPIHVNSPDGTQVVFATTFGTWDGTNNKVVDGAMSGKDAFATLRADKAGTATVQVYEKNNPSSSDTITVNISAPPSEATQITIQAPANIAPSTADVKNSVDVLAIVKNDNDQVVGNAPVTFYIVNPTSGGETISPAVVYTDSSGVATATFTSGTMGTDSNGLTIVAQSVDFPDLLDSTTIIITGTAVSVSIGSSTQIQSNDDNTHYLLPMSVLVTDSNGSPMSNAKVTLKLRPVGYMKGFWVEVEPGTCVIDYEPAQIYESEDENGNNDLDGSEDVNCNNILDEDEDLNNNGELDYGEDLNQDCVLTPPASSAGSLPAYVTTDSDGFAYFNLNYLKDYAGWVQSKLTVTTPYVLGTEIRSVKTFILPWQAGEECSLSHSPFNTDGIEPEISLVTVEAGAESMIADGEQTVKITATVYDSSGLLPGEEVKLFTSLGTFVDADGTDLGNAIGTDTNYPLTTDVTGVATATLRSELTMGTATITAIAGGLNATTTVALVAGLPETVTLALGATTASLGETITLTATVKDANDHAVINEPVIFDVDPNRSNGVFSALTASTDVNGHASVNYTAGGSLGQDVLKVKLANNEDIKDEATLSVSDGATTPIEMLIEASPTVIDANGSSSSEIHVLVRDANNNPVKNGTVYFTTADLTTDPHTKGIGTVTGSATTGDDGFAYVDGTVGNWPVLVSEKRNGVATVTAWYGPSDSPLATITTSVSFSGATISVTATPESLSTDEKTTIQVTLKGASSAPIVDQEIYITTSLGSFVDSDGTTDLGSDPYTARTDTNGNVSVLLTSSTGGTATVMAYHNVTRGKAGETVASTNVIFSGNRLTITPVATTLVATGPTSHTSVVVKLEGDSGPIDGQDISLSTTLGEIDSTVTTDANGEATATLKAGYVIGVATISASAELVGGTLISATKDVPFTSGVASTIEMIIDPSIIKVNTGTSDIRVVVKDSNGNPVGNAPVAFTLISGPGGGETITPATVRTAGPGSANPGQAFAVFTAGSLGSSFAEDVKVEASAGATVQTSANLTISGNPSNISLGTTTSTVTDNNDGTYSIPVSAMVSDVSGISVPAGYVVTFSTSNPELGTFVSPKQTDDTGKATSYLTYPSTKVGEEITITANCVGITANETVTLPAISANVVTEVRAEAPSSILGDGVNDIEVRAQALESDGEYADFTVSYFQTSSEGPESNDFDPDKPSGNVTGATYWGGGETRASYTATPGPDTDAGDAFVSDDYTAYLRATAGGGVHSPIVSILIKGISLTVTPSSTSLLANGTSTTTLTAVLKEKTTGLPIANAELNFGVTNGFVSGSAFTDNSGTASVTYTSVESDTDRTASIRAYYGPDIVATTGIELKASADVAQILVSSDTDTLFNDPTETATITAQVLEANGHPVPDGQKVTFDITSGPGQVESSAVTQNGVAQVQFKATPTTGTATVTATSGTISQTLDIDIIAHRVGALGLVSGADEIVADNSSEVAVRATVYDTNGDPLPAVDVTFTSTLGTITTTNPATTDAQGIAEIRLKSGTIAGTATVTAVIEGFVQKIDIDFTAAAPDATQSSISAAPTAINLGGSTTVTATILDANNNPVSGESVSFVVTTNASGGSLFSSAGVTNSSGKISVIYTAGSGTGIDIIKAIASSNGASVSVNVGVTANASVVGSITLNTGAATLVANNTDEATVRATVLNTNGNPVVGEDVYFSTTLGAITTAQPVSTDANGIATVTFKAGDTAGTATITAVASGFVTTTQISLVAGPPQTVTVTGAPLTLNPGGTSTIGVTVADANTNPVNGETVYFLVSANNSGGNLSAVSATTNVNGQATVTYAAGSTTGVTDKITARTASNGVDGNEISITVDAEAVVVGGVTLSSGSGELVADSSKKATIRATVVDTGGNPAVGVDVDFETTLGTLTGGGKIATVTTGANGIAELILTTGTTVGTAKITADASGFVQSITVAFVAGTPTSVAVSAAPSTVNPGGTSTITALVTDGNSNPVVGETVNFAFDTDASGAALSILSAVTNVNGQAVVTYTAGETIGTDKITASAASNGVAVVMPASIIVSVQATVVNGIALVAGSADIVADGTSQVTIRATVTDINGDPIPSKTVTFETSAGTLPGPAPYTVDTDADGIAEFLLTAPENRGTVTVRAIADGFAQTVDINAIAGEADHFTYYVYPQTVNPGGTFHIDAWLEDNKDNRLQDQYVTFILRKASDNTIVETRADVTAADNVVRMDFNALWGEENLNVTLESTNGKTATFAVTVDADAAVVGSVNLASGAASMIADSLHDTVIRATVLDSSNAAASGITVDFTTTLGTFSNGQKTYSGTSDDNGIVEATLTSGTTAGIATVTAKASGFVKTTEVAFVAGDPTGININAAPGTVNPAGTSTVTARVTDVSGNPVIGETVGFYIDPLLNNSGGAIAPVSAVTNINGVATASYTAGGDAGTDTIRATAQSNGTSSTKDITVGLQNQIVGEVNVTAGAASLPADEASAAAIRATVTDTNGDPMQGVTVTFSTTSGTLSGTTDTTDDNGIAEVNLTAPANTGTGTVTASYNGFSGSASVTFTSGPADHIILYASPDTVNPGDAFQIAAIVLDSKNNRLSNERVTIIITKNGSSDVLDTTEQVTDADGVLRVDGAAAYGDQDLDITASTSNGTTKTVTVTVDAAAVVVGGIDIASGADTLVADGSTTIIRATVTDTEGNAAEGIDVTFETTAGTITAGPIATNSSGIAEATLTSSTNAGTANITAIASGFRKTTIVTFIAGAPETISVAATPGNLTADGTSTSTINIIVRDANGNPVNGETLTISVDEGTLNNLTTATVNGLASVTYTAPNSVPTDGRGTITVEAANGKSGTADITLIGQQIASITLSASPTSLPADGSSQAVISATLTLVGGGAVPDGTTVDFTITDSDGNGNDQITAQASTSSGVALATLTSDDIQGTAVIQATAGGRTAQIQVEYTPGSISLLVVPNSILGTGDKTSDITVTVLDAAGAPLVGETVKVTLDDLSLGTVFPASTATGANGKATFQFTGAAKGGTVTITASYDPDVPDNAGNDNDVTGTASIDIQEPPAFMEVADGYPSYTSINIKGTGGQSTSQLVFDVKDINGNAVADGYRIDFEILSGPNGGEAIEPSSTTTANGQIATILRSGTKSGPVSIKATYYNNTNISTTTSQIAINAGPPVGEEFGIFAQYLNISGLSVANLQDQISVNVGDIYGNAVPDGTAISFKTYNTGGFFTYVEPDTSSPTSNGLAANMLHSGGTSPQPLNGFLSVTAEAINGGRTTHVTSIAVNPADNDIMYVGTDGGGVYKSADAGASWTNVSRSSSLVSRNFIDPYVNGISVDPDDPNTVYAATGYLGGGHVYRSKDSGASWNSNDPEEWNGVLSVGSSVQTVLCDNGGPYVWAGTHGMGAVFATDGENFQWGGTSTVPVAGGGNTGNGTMSTPTLGLTAVTEDWTVTYAKDGAETSTPVFTGSAVGSMSGLSATSAASNELWTVTYTGGYSGVTFDDGGGAAATTDLAIVTTYSGTLTEVWTLTCTDDTAGAETFLVIGGKSGLQDDQVTVNTSYVATGGNGDAVKFYIVGGPYAIGDKFEFSTMADGWSVSGGTSGAQTAARTGVAYTSDNGAVSFTIDEPTGQFYETGDKFTFTTTITGEWIVAGTDAGTQSNRAENNVAYISDNEEVSFTISQGGTAFEPGDSFTFSTTGSGLGYGKLVAQIVKAGGTGATATLYAATATGVYKTTDGGQIWERKTNFTGDDIQSLVVHPQNANVIYAGTAERGVYYSPDAGASWTPVTGTGLGQGLSATDPTASSGNTGNGVMSAVDVLGYANTKSENWTVTCTAAAANGGTFSVKGSVSGDQTAYTITAGAYTLAGVMSFTITDGSTDFVAGDTFTFSTTRDPGKNIKDLMVYDDGTAYYLYAATYFNGELEPHAVGNVYSLPLDGGTGLPSGVWSAANTGLPAYDPPGDETLFAQHALATNNPATPTALFVGGEGINFYRATDVTSLQAGDPDWVESGSESGLTNTIMARMPILFSGPCTMNVYKVERVGDVVTYTVYIEDGNGNPPVQGSNFNVVRKYLDDITTLVDITYSDGYTHAGTWSDPSDPGTNNPYVFSTTVDTDVKVILTFTPACSLTDAPGCSGGTQTATDTY